MISSKGLTVIILLEFSACLKTKSCAITPGLERLNHQQSWDYLHSLHRHSLLQAQCSKINKIIRKFSYFRAKKPEILRFLSITKPNQTVILHDTYILQECLVICINYLHSNTYYRKDHFSCSDWLMSTSCTNFKFK